MNLNIKNKKQNIKEIIILLTLLLIGSLMIFLPELLDTNTFIQGHDAERQMHPFYLEMGRLFKQFFENGTFPFYSWNMYLGTNFYASQTFYVFGEIYGLIGLFFDMNYFTLSMILDMIKLIVAGISMYFLLKKYKFDYKIVIIGSLCYAFSTWTFAFSDHPTFLAFYSFMPLFFTGMESYIQQKKFILFVLSTTLLLTTNYYYFFTLCCFAPFYFIFRYYMLELNWREFFTKVIKIIGFFLIGVGMSMFLLLPTIFYIIGNDRIGEMAATFFYVPQVYYHLLSSLIIPQYPISTVAFSTGWYTTDEIFLLSSLLITLLLPQVFFIKDKKLGKASLAIFFGLFLIAIFPLAATVIHGFAEPSFRWTLFAILFLIILGCSVLENLRKINKKVLLLTAIMITLLMACLPLISLVTTNAKYADYLANSSLFLPLIFSFLVLSIFTIIMYFQPKHLFKILIITILFETAIYGHYSIVRWKNADINTYAFQEKLFSVLQSDEGEFVENIKNLDEKNSYQFYRTYVPFTSLFWEYGYNMPLAYGFQGFMTYQSTYAPSLNELINYFPEITRNSESWTMSIEDYDLLTFLNMKYAVVTNESELPSEGDFKLITDKFNGWLSVYENNNYRSLGTTYSLIEEYPDFIDAKSLLNTLYVNPNDYKEVKEYLESDVINSLESINYNGNYLYGTINSNKSSFMVITLPYDEGWNIKVNGKEVKKYNVNCGFIGIPIESGNNSIEMFFTPQGFKSGCLITLASTVIFAGFISMTCFKRRRETRNEK